MHNSRFPLLLTGSLTGLFVLCATPAASQQLQISERWSTSGNPAIMEWGYIAGMAEGPDGTVWVSDNLGQGRVGEIDSSGRIREIAAGHGDGPGEVRHPTLMAPRPDGGVAILDIGHNAVELFDRDGDFEQRVILGRRFINPKGFMVGPDGEFIISGGLLQGENSIHRFRATGELGESWYPAPETQERMVGLMIAGGPVSRGRDGSVLFSQSAPHRIMRFSGGRAALVARDESILAPIGDDFAETTGSGANRTTTFRWSYPQSRGVFELPNGNILNVIWMLEDDRSIWQVYSPAGARIAQQAVARAYEPWAIASNGDILASYRDSDTGEHIAVRLRLTSP